jgi:hypothetical protein
MDGDAFNVERDQDECTNGITEVGIYLRNKLTNIYMGMSTIRTVPFTKEQ